MNRKKLMFLRKATALIVTASFLCTSLAYGSSPLYGTLGKDPSGNFVVESIGTNRAKTYFDFAARTPDGYSTRDRSCLSSLWSLGGNTRRCGDMEGDFTSFSTDWGSTIGMNTVGQVFLLMPLIFWGVVVERKAYFDHQKFGVAVNSAMQKIDADGIIQKYNEMTNKLSVTVQEQNKMAATRFQQILDAHQKIQKTNQQRVTIKTAVIDHTGFWNESRKLPKLEFRTNELFYSAPILDFPFPGIEATPSTFFVEIGKIESDLKAALLAAENNLPGQASKYEEDLSKLSRQLNLPHSHTYTIDDFTIELQAPTSVTAGSDTDSVSATYTIKSRDWHNVFPEYSNSDENIKVELNDGVIRITNKTQRYASVNSITAYYNSEVNNFTREIELPPDTYKDISAAEVLSASNVQKQASYYGVDKAKASNTNFTFGLAVKYRVVDKNLEKSLYKTFKYNLEKTLKASL